MKKELLLVTLLALCSCTNTNNSNTEKSISENFSSVVELSTNNAPFDVSFIVEDILDVDIHTELQQKYFNGNVSSAAGLADGTKELSKPQPTTISWFMEDYDVPEEYIDKFEKFNVYLYNDESLTNPRVFEVIADNCVDVDNLFINHTHYYEVEAVFGEYSFKSETKKIVTKAGIIRNLNVDGVTNVRDLGNYKTSDNKRVKQGLLFRSGRFNTNYTTTAEITSKGLDTIHNELKIQTEIDLRAKDEAGELIDSILGDPVVYKRIDYSYYTETTFNYLFNEPNKSGAKKFFKELANENNYPIDFHCSIGTDRTGYLAYLTLAFLGVSEEDCTRDYMFSNYGNIGSSRTTDRLWTYLKSRIENELDGDTLKEKITNYLLGIGVSESELQSIRDILLEDID